MLLCFVALKLPVCRTGHCVNRNSSYVNKAAGRKLTLPHADCFPCAVAESASSWGLPLCRFAPRVSGAPNDFADVRFGLGAVDRRKLLFVHSDLVLVLLVLRNTRLISLASVLIEFSNWHSRVKWRRTFAKKRVPKKSKWLVFRSE